MTSQVKNADLSDRLIAGPDSWDNLRAAFKWPDPDSFNIADAVCDRWARIAPDKPALIHPREGRDTKVYSFGELSRLSDKLAGVLACIGIAQGDRVAILLPQCPEVLLVHLASYKRGAIVVPLFTLFGVDGLSYRLKHSGAKTVITDAANLAKVTEIAPDLPDLETVFSIDGAATDDPEGVRDFWGAMLANANKVAAVETTPDTPALLVYTSGTTGPPKGALHGHRVLLGHMPGVETHHDFFPQAGDVMWTPADWAWMGGLMDVLMPSLFCGVPVVAHRMARFEAEAAYDLIRDHKVRNVFLPPTALKMMRQTPPEQPLGLRSVASGGEALGAGLLDWGREHFGLTINEFYGSTECNLVLGNSATSYPPKPGSTGRAVPGKEVAVLDASGAVVPDGTLGEIAVRRGDPAMFLEYWGDPERTASRFAGDWLRMGDEAYMDAEGYVFFAARTDDVITSAGYRIGPTEIEECLTGHPSVTMAAAIGVPDAERGEVVKAFVVLTSGTDLDTDLEAELIERVRTRISPHVAPRSVVMIDTMPMTATGKIMRRDLRGL